MKAGVVIAIATLFGLQLLAVALPARSAPDARMWVVVRTDDWDVMVRSIGRRFDPLSGPNGELVRPTGSFATLAVDLTNRSDRPLIPRTDDFALWSAEGVLSVNLAGSSVARAFATAEGRTPFGDSIPPGATVTTVILFDIDAHAGRLTLHFRDQPIRIDECKCDLPSPVRTVSPGS